MGANRKMKDLQCSLTVWRHKEIRYTAELYYSAVLLHQRDITVLYRIWNLEIRYSECGATQTLSCEHGGARDLNDVDESTELSFGDCCGVVLCHSIYYLLE